jgi:serine/threonine-protein kinase
MSVGDGTETIDVSGGRLIGGKFRLIAQLGEGATGTVYRACHEDLERIVALKILHDEGALQENAALRFLSEARAASRLDHPNVVRVLDLGEDDPGGRLYIVMELVDGGSLADLIAREAPLAPATIGDVMVQVLSAVANAHANGIIHRDLKPANVMLVRGRDDDGSEHWIAKVGDFGLAKALDTALVDSGGAPLTRFGTIVGTPLYMSPEQASGGRTNGLTDAYACGVMMYEMLTGRVPFLGDDSTKVLMMHLLEDAPPILTITPHADRDLAALAMRALEKDPDKRPSAREMLAELKALGY